MRKSYSLFGFLCVVILAACTSASTLPPTATSTPYRIALVMKTLANPFFVEMEKGGRRAEREFGITLIVRTAAQETSVEQEIQIVEDMIRDHVDAIVISPGDSRELIPVLKKAQDAHIVIVNIDNQLDPDESKRRGLVGVPFISVDNVQGAYLAAKYLSDQIKVPAQAVILEGLSDARNAQDRKAGALKAFQENPNIQVVASERADWKIDEAYSVTKSLFAAHPQVTVVFAENDMMALGAAQYLKESHNTKVLVGGFDSLPVTQQALKDGSIQVTIDQQAGQQGYLGVKMAISMLKGEKPASVTLINVVVVTANSVQ